VLSENLFISFPHAKNMHARIKIPTRIFMRILN
jgi:hypothetical protein